MTQSVVKSAHVSKMTQVSTLVLLVVAVALLSHLLDGSIPTCHYVWHNSFKACEQAKFWAWGEF